MDILAEFFGRYGDFLNFLYTFLQNVSHKDLTFRMEGYQYQPPEEYELVLNN